MSDTEEMKNKAEEAAQQERDQAEQEGQSMKDKSGGMMDEAKKKMDRTGDGKFDAEDVKKMGEDAVNKVKGLFKKD
jgi:ElaB/YqjD/DUF883 family membrane-anchored ribosome-binding protein